MTQEEARLFFPYDENDDLSDLYVERLFEHKQFFLSKTPIRKVFEARLEKLIQMDKAYGIITGNEAASYDSELNEAIGFSDNILTAFNQWENLKGKSKQLIMFSQTALSLRKNVMDYLQIVDEYRLKWYAEDEINVEISQLSKDEDPMEILSEIKLFEQGGGIYFEDILKLGTNSFLLKEMKRLSLLVKNYSNGRSI